MVTFVPDADDQTVARYYARCKALIIPGVEDFGLTAVEAQAAGAPVIAFGEGGVRESVIGVNGTTPLPKATGVFFESQTVESLVAAIGRCEATTFEREALAASVARFGVERFRREFRAEVDAL
jgi:glycosyltransferase involved in cell wall biosynthesis